MLLHILQNVRTNDEFKSTVLTHDWVEYLRSEILEYFHMIELHIRIFLLDFTNLKNLIKNIGNQSSVC